MPRRFPLLMLGLLVITTADAARAAVQPDRQAIRETDRAGTIPAGEGVSRAAERATQREAAQALAWSRDPFLPGGAAADLGELTCSGILWDPQRPLALINGLTVGVGEEVAGYRVLEITRDAVTVSDGSQTVTLRIAP